MHVYLKIKIKSLTNEAQAIRKEERRININARGRTSLRRDIQLGTIRDLNNQRSEHEFSEAQIIRIQKKLDRSRNILNNPNAQARFKGLRNHRTIDVRKEARSSFIAYGFLRGNDYKNIESTIKKVDWDRVISLVKKYCENDPRVTLQKFAEWVGASGMALKA
jgi:hypothetical protein